MDCRTARKLIPILLDGELTGPRSQQLTEHIATCADCSSEMAALKSVAEALGAWHGVEPRRTYADFHVRAEQAGAHAGRRQSMVWSLSPRWALAAVVAIAFLGGSTAGMYHGARMMPHTHVLAADARQASDSLRLDTFDGGLNEALVNTETAPAEVTK